MLQAGSAALAGLAGLRPATAQHMGHKPTSRPSSSPTSQPHRVAEGKTGAEVWQVTTERHSNSNIYCEVPWCSKSGRCFVYARGNRALKDNATEFMVTELGTWKQHRLDVAASGRGCAITPDGILYYLKRTSGGAVDLVKADLDDGSPKAVFRLEGEDRVFAFGTLGAVSPDHRYYVVGKPMENKQDLYGLVVVDLEKQTKIIIDQDPYVLNAHPQFNPGNPRQLMIQYNRGGKLKPDGTIERLTGPEGTTLYLLSVPDGRKTWLAVGKPDTTPISGHQAWAGTTGKIVLTVAPAGDYIINKGNLLTVGENEPARMLAKDYFFLHVGVSRCGRLFSCDDWQGNRKIVIGSVKTGKTAEICESFSTAGRDQSTHPHPYLTPDLKWVVFNSDRSGWPHIHAASVPESIVKDLLSA